MIKFFSMLLCVFALTGTGIIPARAASENAAHYKNALRSQQAGHYEKAILQYTQTLLFESHPRDASTRLRRILQNDKTVAPDMRPLWSRFLELADFISFLQNYITQVDADNAKTLAFIRTSGASAKDVQAAGRLMKQTPDTNENPSNKLFIQSFPESLEGSPQLSLIIDLLNKRKSELLARLETEQHRRQKLWEIRNRLVGAIINGETASAPAVPAKNNGKEPYALLSRQIHSLQMQVNDTKKKTARLIRQVADLSMQVYEKDTQLAQKTEQTDRLQQKLDETQQRFFLVQHLLLEKDRTIEALQVKPAEGQKSLAESAGVTDKDMNALSADFIRLQKHSQTVPQIAGLVRALGTQVRDLQSKFLIMDQHLKNRDKELARLQKELAKQKNELASGTGHNAVQEEKMAQLNGIIEIYKAKLGETRRRLQEAQLELYMRSLKDQNARAALNKQQGISSFDLDGAAAWTDAGILQRIKTHLRNETNSLFRATAGTGTELGGRSPGAVMPNVQGKERRPPEKTGNGRSET